MKNSVIGSRRTTMNSLNKMAPSPRKGFFTRWLERIWIFKDCEILLRQPKRHQIRRRRPRAFDPFAMRRQPQCRHMRVVKPRRQFPTLDFLKQDAVGHETRLGF